jgi:ankyrin repeat protein
MPGEQEQGMVLPLPSEMGNTELHLAARNGDVAKLHALLEAGDADLCAQNKLG